MRDWALENVCGGSDGKLIMIGVSALTPVVGCKAAGESRAGLSRGPDRLLGLTWSIDRCICRVADAVAVVLGVGVGVAVDIADGARARVGAGTGTGGELGHAGKGGSSVGANGGHSSRRGSRQGRKPMLRG